MSWLMILLSPESGTGTSTPPQLEHRTCMCYLIQTLVNPPPVMALSSVAPISCNSSELIGGPSIHVPSAWQQTPQPLLPESSGYSAQHRHYTAQCKCWGWMAHNPPPTEMISLEISVVFEAGGKKKNFKWVDLARHSSLQGYFYNDCLHASNKKGLKAIVFKSKQFILFIIMPAINATTITSSTSSGSSPAPLQKKIATTFLSPNCNQIKEALHAGGACKFNVRTVFWQRIIQVDFYAIPMCDLDDLVTKKSTFDIQDAELISGSVQLDL
ncbi:hypothetical protein EDD16DRAFT_1526115 [Pisolithus croceorrhizus]|nr:hypothetical protein EV401DRAFT_1895820 [Pisolithus croceorrhizus]KAI6100954.1 hypothetical protein EDD16DRAFT_1526115 [Pisolithus croceorrhizus]KAI6167163.1 hypothetical protein EDD17DRAFT_1504861 [Pisolithus thermaeus]